jgi:RNA polymerase sigma-70 factor (ECF subfamily)
MIATTSEYGSAHLRPTAAEGPTPRETSARREALHDAELVRRFRLGDEDAFAAIFARYRDRMFAIAFSHLRNHADAEEIAQDTFIQAHRGMARFRGDSSLATWLHRIAFNLSRNRHRHNFCRRRHLTLSLDCALGVDNQDTFADTIASDAPSPSREAAVSEFTETVARCMERLGPDQREILKLRNGLSQSYGEIGRTLGTNIGTVKSRIGRARESLRALLAVAYADMAPEAEEPTWFEPARPMGLVAVASA